MVYFVYSSLISRNYYADHSVAVKKGVFLNGANDVIDGVTSSGLIGSQSKFKNGISLTKVNDEQMKILKENETFCKHVNKGFILVSEEEMTSDKVKLNLSEKLRSPSANV